jgi:N6-L-threonylcarbamoyladenine synthase
VAKAALEGDDHAFVLPKAKLDGKYDFSFSGLKTAVLRQAQALIGEDYTFASKNLPERLSEAQKADIAATFQRVAVETIVDKALTAVDEFSPASVVIAGGVAASSELRQQLIARLPLPIEFPDLKLCTDNGAMVASLGAYRALLGQPTADPYTLDIAPNLSM